jgi:hypothetical protein
MVGFGRGIRTAFVGIILVVVSIRSYQLKNMVFSEGFGWVDIEY